jgi:hypothetical protein
MAGSLRHYLSRSLRHYLSRSLRHYLSRSRFVPRRRGT